MRKMQAGSMEFVVADCYLLAHKVAQSLFINAQYFGRVAIPGAHQTIPDQRGFRKERELPIAHAKCAWAGETQCNSTLRRYSSQCLPGSVSRPTCRVGFGGRIHPRQLKFGLPHPERNWRSLKKIAAQALPERAAIKQGDSEAIGLPRPQL